MSRPGISWAKTSACLLLLSLFLGLALVWCNIERMDVAYDLRRLNGELDATKALVEKLEVERDNLLTPHRLRTLAEKYGLEPARSGRIRRLEIPASPQEQTEE